MGNLTRSVVLALALSVPTHAADFQFEDNVRELLASAKSLIAQDQLEEAALEYENVLQIDGLHRDAALAVFDLYLKLGAAAAAEDLLPGLSRMGVDSAQTSALRTKLDGVKANPPPKRKRVFTAAAPPAAPAVAPAPAAAATGTKPGPVDDIDDIGDLGGPAPSPAAPAAPAPKASPAGGKDDVEDLL